MQGLIAVNVLVHLVLPACFLAWLAWGQHRSRARFVAASALAAAFIVRMGFAGGAWSWFGLWWPWLLYASFPLACGVGVVRRWRSMPWWPERKALAIASVVFNGLLALLFLSAIPFALAARTYEGEALALAPPLAGGRVVVGHGGSNVLLNAHAEVPAQRYALDISGLAGQTRADGLYPEELTGYAIWGRPVIAPCAGSVVAVENALPDLAPGTPNATNEEAAGNHVILRCGAHHVVLAHLQRGSVTVAVGAEVAIGTPLGLAGNSGNTSEPHLHIHAVSADATDRRQLLWTGSGAPMTFNGRFLVRGDTADW